MSGSFRFGQFSGIAAICAPLALCSAPAAHAQVFVVQPEHIEQHYSQIDPTSVKLPEEPLTTVGRERLVRFMEREQGFAMRPIPVGNVDLAANGQMNPSGEKYINELHQKGISAKPGDRLVVTNIRIRDNSLILDLNNGPDHKHKYLRHISIGMGGAETPLAPYDGGQAPTGSRLTLTFPHRVPEISGEQLEALLKPMIDFGVKSPAEAYAESLPEFLRKAIMEHRVLIGMDKDMVVFAKGQPTHKDREEVDGKSTEIWIYGESPQPVEFIRFEGNSVVRTELAKVGAPIEVRTADEMGDYKSRPAVAANQHEVQLGDKTAADAAEENAPKAPPTLRNPGEKLPTDGDQNHPTMAPVKMPPDLQRPGDPGYTPPDNSGQSGGQQSGNDNPLDKSSGSGSNSGSSSGSGTGQKSSNGNPGNSAPAQQPQQSSSSSSPQ